MCMHEMPRRFFVNRISEYQRIRDCQSDRTGLPRMGQLPEAPSESNAVRYFPGHNVIPQVLFEIWAYIYLLVALGNSYTYITKDVSVLSPSRQLKLVVQPRMRIAHFEKDNEENKTKRR